MELKIHRKWKKVIFIFFRNKELKLDYFLSTNWKKVILFVWKKGKHENLNLLE